MVVEGGKFLGRVGRGQYLHRGLGEVLAG
jgi:hypothetical protein